MQTSDIPNLNCIHYPIYPITKNLHSINTSIHKYHKGARKKGKQLAILSSGKGEEIKEYMYAIKMYQFAQKNPQVNTTKSHALLDGK